MTSHSSNISTLEVGQVLSLRIRFNNSGDISKNKHPYLIVDIDSELGVVEIAQIDSLQGKRQKALMRSNKVIFCDNPAETVIDKHSYVQLDNTIRIEDFVGIELYRRQLDKLSETKLVGVLTAYKDFHDKYEIDPNKNVYMSQSEIISIN